MMKKNKFTKLKCFINSCKKWVWTDTDKRPNIIKNTIRAVIQTFYLSLKGYIGDKAAVLTYKSIFAIIPLIAILYGIARGFGYDTILELQILSGLKGQDDAAHAIINFAHSYLSNTQSNFIIGIGLFFFLLTFYFLISKVEDTFNDIWQIKHSRRKYTKITELFSLLFLSTIFIVVSGGLSIYLNTLMNSISFGLLTPLTKLIIIIFPLFIWSILYAAIYQIIPNTRVEFKYSLTSGFMAALVELFLQKIFIIIIPRFLAGYNIIYGSFSAFPIFLFWLYFSWLGCLIGVQFCFCIQNIKYLHHKNTELNHYQFELANIIILSLICKSFNQEEKKQCNIEQLSEASKLPPGVVAKIVKNLLDMQFIYEIKIDKKENKNILKPAFNINSMTIGCVMEKLNQPTVDDDEIKGHFENVETQYPDVTNKINDFYKQIFKDNTLLKDLDIKENIKLP